MPRHYMKFDLTLEKGGREGREEEEEEWNAIHRGRSFAAKMAQLMLVPLNIMLTSNPGDIRDHVRRLNHANWDKEGT